MTKRTNRIDTHEFRREAVALATDQGYSVFKAKPTSESSGINNGSRSQNTQSVQT